MDDDSFEPDPFDLQPRRGTRRPDQLLTLALLEDIAAVLDAHGFPPLTGYALVDLTSSFYRLI